MEPKEPTSEELVSKGLHPDASHIERLLAQRLESAREAMRETIACCDACFDGERCAAHRRLEEELSK